MSTEQQIQSFLLKEVSNHSRDIVSFAADALSVTRMTVYRHMQKLIQQGKIIQSGKRRSAEYFLVGAKNKKITFMLSDIPGEFDIWSQYFKDDFLKLPKNVFEICDYGFTEILNNAIEHSEGKQIVVEINWKQQDIVISMLDDGIGIFQKLKNAFQYDDLREGILYLSKGKVTTDPENHTGEGIFFSSRAFDTFQITANGLSYCKDNVGEDWLIEDSQQYRGTLIIMTISQQSHRDLIALFKAFQNEEDLSFDRTHILVALSQLKEERLISRSQAKRILMGLEKFRKVVLDFKGVDAVGQGFVDEVFRVFQQKYKYVRIEYVNANENVDFMIKRGIATGEM